MIFSSLAGCIGDEELEAIEEATDLLDDISNTTIDNTTVDLGVLGTVMVSTYHVGELVKGIAGEHVDLEYMSLANIPVHDYEPSASDLIRLQNSDVFFYHGLGLEPWVEATLASLGSDAPTSIQVHTMPTGEETLDYQSLLVSNLCETLSEGPYEVVELVDEEEHADDVEIHAEFVAHNITFPHDDHADEEGNHSEDGHDDHDDGHENHAHLDAEQTLSNPAGCPADTMISIFHLEEGEYIMEFDAEHAEDFTMAVLKMLGGHAHHDHGDHGDEHGDEHDGHGDEHFVCHDMSDHSYNDIDNQADCEAAGFMWMEEDNHDDHEGDYCHDATTHENTNHTTEEECEAAGHIWIEEDDHDSYDDPCDAHGDEHDDHDGHDDQITPEDALEEADSNNDSHVSWDEFWASWSSDDQDDHGDEHDDHGDDHDEEHHSVVVLFPDNCLQMYMAEHDALPENATGWNLTTSAMMGDDSLMLNYSVHETYGTSLSGINGFDAPEDYSWWWQLMLWNDTENNTGWDVSDLGIDSVMIPEMTEHIAWMPNIFNVSSLPDLSMMHDDHDDHDDHGDDGHDNDHGDDEGAPTPQEFLNMTDTDGNGTMSFDEFIVFLNSTIPYDANAENESLPQSTVDELRVIFDSNDADQSGELDLDELDQFIMDIDEYFMSMDGEPTQEELQFLFNASDMDGDQLLNITELGVFIEMLDDHGDDNHADEEDHHPVGYVTLHVNAEGDYGFALPMDVEFHIMMAEGGHDDHAGEEGDHDDHADEEGVLDYDPHSWLSPLAFNAQVTVVLDALTTAFPAGGDVFTANAGIYSTQLLGLHVAYDAAFGQDGLCMAGGYQQTVAANHNAYSYIAEQYNIQFMAVHGLDPEGEPSPADVAKVVDFITEEGITVLFVEEYTDQSLVQSIVDQTNVTIQILYTMEMAPSDSSDDYMTMMAKNLENFVQGIGC
jgi:ABC-type Zn uptake system ZnuABC Zn-binding protein ZnuA/Ca2+-binding EF-hand superfamily protein